ncbi:5728_t:CDS:2, partial [Scutellospora calospora]
MGLPARRKRVVLPAYKLTDHTPPIYNDPCSNRPIPVGYFLNNLDEIGPAHWGNTQSADYSLKIIKPQEVDFFCSYFNQFCKNNNFPDINLDGLYCTVRNNWIINNGGFQTSENFEWQEQYLLDYQSSLPVTCSDKFCSAADAAALTLYFNATMISYQQFINNLQHQATSGIPSPPSSPHSSPPSSPIDDKHKPSLTNITKIASPPIPCFKVRKWITNDLTPNKKIKHKKLVVM